MERLSGLDSAFLSMETPTMHLHVAIAAVIDPTTMAAPYEFEQLKAFVERRLMRDPAFRRRVVAVPFGLNHPIWVEDPDIDLDYHIRRHVLPFPGGPRELTDLTGSIVSVPLDRSRPLWEIHVVEGLHDGNIALIGKIHHAAVDGVSGAELFVHLFDLTPDAADTGPVSEPTPTGPVAPEHIPSDVELVGHALLSQARRTISLPALVGRTARTITHLVNRHRDPETVVGAVPLRAPRTPWSAAITPHRSVAFARARLSDLKRVRAAFDVKVNDVVLAVVSGAVRRYLAERDALPDEPLVAMCPVSVRDEDERGRPDNRVSAMFVYLRTDMEEVTSRLRSIAHSTRGAKDDHHAIGAKFLQNWAEHAAPSTFALATRLYSRLNVADRHPPIYNVVVSNVPGPDFPLYLDGARLVATYPMGPIMEGAGLNVTVLSHLDNVDFGFLAGAELVPDVWDMADHVDAAMAELLEAAAAIDGLDPVPPPVPEGDAAPAAAPGGEHAPPPPVGGDDAEDTGGDATGVDATGVDATGADAGPRSPADIATNGDATPPPPGTVAEVSPTPVAVLDGADAERATAELPKITRAAARKGTGKSAAGRKKTSGKKVVAATGVSGAPPEQTQSPVGAVGQPPPVVTSAPAWASSGKVSTRKATSKQSAVAEPAAGAPTAKKSKAGKTTAKDSKAKASTAKPSAAGAKSSTAKPATARPTAKKPAAKKLAATPSAAGESTAKESTTTPATARPTAKKPTAKELAATPSAAGAKSSTTTPATAKSTAKKPTAKKLATKPSAARESTAPPATAETTAKKPTAKKLTAEPSTTGKPTAKRLRATVETQTADTPTANGAVAGESRATPPVSGMTSPPPSEPAPATGTPADDAATDTAVVDLVTTTAIPTV